MRKAGVVGTRDVIGFFEVYNVEHLKALARYQVTGRWPDGFLPDTVYCSPGFETELSAAVELAWGENYPMEAREWQAELERVQAVIDDINMPGYQFILEPVGDLFSIQVSYVEPDVMSGVPEEQRGRRWVFPAGQTRGQISQTAFKAIMTSLEHRAREQFLYRGRPVLNP